LSWALNDKYVHQADKGRKSYNTGKARAKAEHSSTPSKERKFQTQEFTER
jgi:hypothetical protein